MYAPTPVAPSPPALSWRSARGWAAAQGWLAADEVDFGLSMLDNDDDGTDSDGRGARWEAMWCDPPGRRAGFTVGCAVAWRADRGLRLRRQEPLPRALAVEFALVGVGGGADGDGATVGDGRSGGGGGGGGCGGERGRCRRVGPMWARPARPASRPAGSPAAAASLRERVYLSTADPLRDEVGQQQCRQILHR